ncbi:MAG: hypothetical protein V7604_4029 [Hyphomicrobiales bacterium]
MARKTAANIDQQADEEFIEQANPEHVGGRPRSDITGKHDEGSDANETIDGLDEEAEDLRRNTEDVPTGTKDPFDKLPVFDRAEAERKV